MSKTSPPGPHDHPPAADGEPGGSGAVHAEFRPYRRFVTWVVLGFVSLGSAYLLVSVAVTIYRWRHAVLLGSPVADMASRDELESCQEELADVSRGLAKHLKDSSRLLGNYDVGEVQRWYEDRSFWVGQWTAVGRRCRFDTHHAGPHAKEWEGLATAHAELRQIETSYTAELMRFGEEQAPRLDRVRDRLNRIGRTLGTTGDNPERAQGPRDSERPQ